MADTNCGCTITNPCVCLGGSLSFTKPYPCPVKDCCLKACSGLVECEDSVGPCGQVGTFDLKTLKLEESGCAEDTVVYRLNCYDESIFTSVVISTDGILTFVTGGPETAGKYGEISYKKVCKAKEDCENCFELAANADVTIGVRDLCLAHSCESTQYCDACTGACIDNDVNIAADVESSDSNINSQID